MCPGTLREVSLVEDQRVENALATTTIPNGMYHHLVDLYHVCGQIMPPGPKMGPPLESHALHRLI